MSDIETAHYNAAEARLTIGEFVVNRLVCFRLTNRVAMWAGCQIRNVSTKRFETKANGKEKDKDTTPDRIHRFKKDDIPWNAIGSELL
jgi:hypothetical protein